MRRTLLTTLSVAWLVASSADLQAVDSPYDIGGKTQLFVDRTLVHESQNVSFTLHPGEKHPQNPLLKADNPWEGWRLEIYGSVLYDEQENIFKMWYFADAKDYFPDYATYYATSKDGIHWEKPLIGTAKSLKPGKHNAVAAGVHLTSVFKDLAEPDPAKRYKMVCWRETKPHGAQTMVSPDGLNWTQVAEKNICRASDVITAFYDPYRQQYIAFPKLITNARGQIRRTFGLSTSQDFATWTPTQDNIFMPDLRDDAGSLARIEKSRYLLDRPDDPQLMRTEFYGIGAYAHESCTIAFPWIFTINNNARYRNHEGPIEIQLAVSRDLKKWDRPFRTPIVPLGGPGEWDEGILVTSSSAIQVGDEIWLYYGGANYTHGTPVLYRSENTGRHSRYTGSIGLVRWPLDRFVSVDATTEKGTLTTVPVQFDGNRLEINAATAESGSVVVQLCDPTGKPLPGYEKSDSFNGDELRQTITFAGNADLSSLTGQPVVVRFQLENAQLYSFGFKPTISE